MLWPALEDPDPVLIFEHGALYNVEGELRRRRRRGRHRRAPRSGAPGATSRSSPTAASLPKALDAADELAGAGHRRRGDRPARRCARSTTTTILGSVRAHAPRRRRRRGLAQRQHLGRGQRADHGERVLRARRAGRAGLQRRGADAVRQAPRGGRAAAGRPASSPRRSEVVSAMGEFRMPSLGADMDAGTVVEWLVQARRRGAPRRHRRRRRHRQGRHRGRDLRGGVIDELLVPGGRRGCRSARRWRVVDARPPPDGDQRRPTLPGTPRRPRPAGRRPAEPRRRRRQPAGPVAADPGRRPGRGADPARHVAGRAPPRPPPRRRPRPPSPARGPGGAITRGRRRARRRSAGGGRSRPSARTAPTDARRPSVTMRRAIANLDGPLEARDPALLPGDRHRPDAPRWRWLEQANARTSGDERLLPAALLLKAVALAAPRGPGAERLLGRRRVRPGARRPPRRRDLAARRRPRRAGDPRRRQHGPRRADGGAARPRRSGRAAGRLRSSEMSDPTITVTNLGDQGVDTVFGVIYPPQVALVGFGKIVERPWADDGMVGARPVVTATLAADHRATDGLAGARFLAVIDRLLQDPEDAVNDSTRRRRVGHAGAGRARGRPRRASARTPTCATSSTSTRWTSSTSWSASTSAPASTSPSATTRS